MKKYIHIILFALLAFGLSSCEDYFGDINVDPDNPTSATPNVLLPVVEGRLAVVLGGDASRFSSIMTQHVNGIGRQFVVFNDYGMNGGDLDAMWSNMYSGVLADLRQMQVSSVENEFNHWTGVAQALEAYSWMLMTDMFGDIPFTEAMQGTNVLQPTFDGQSVVYDGIFTLLDNARANLAADDGGFPVSAADLIYNGDIAKWVAFCNVLEARGRMHLGNVDAANYQRALDALAKGGFTSGDDSALFPFGASAAEAAPWFQYLEQRTDTDVGAAYVSLLEGDPRADVLGFTHTPEGDHPIFTQGRAFPILTYMEQKFIEAEALARTGGDGSAALALAVGESFAQTGVDGAAFIAGLSASADDIVLQKYLAMICDPEVYNDWRRTGVPALTANISTPEIGNEIPRKFPYAQTEMLSNTNTPVLGINEIFTRVWWDQ